MTPSVSPGDDDDGDVSKGALPDVCVPIQLSRRKALRTITRQGAFYHVGSRSLHLLCTMDERHTHADVQILYITKQLHCPTADPTKCSNLCVYEQPRNTAAHLREETEPS